MIRSKFVTAFTPAVLLLCGGVSRIQAADTKVVVKDGGSLLLRADGMNAGTDWKSSKSEMRHLNNNGMLTGLQITDAGADRCGGDPKCGVDPAKPWTVRVIYDARAVTIASVSGNKGLHLKFSRKIYFDQWKKGTNADEREFGHGDGHSISSVKVNDGATNLCSGKGGCEITLVFSPK